MTTESRKPARARLSRRALRGWAWLMGALAFFLPWGVIGGQPKPTSAKAATRPIIKRIVVIHRVIPADPVIRYVYAPTSGSASSSSGGYVAPTASSGGGGTTSGGTAPAPAPAPVTSSGGS